MSKAFNKGDQVTLIGSWDNKGTVFYRNAVVHSCGKKQMVLTCATTGEELGRHYRPERGALEKVTGFNWVGVWPRLSREEAEALCLEVGALVVKANREHLAERRIRFADAEPGYFAALDKSEAELHEPRALDRLAA